MPTSEARINANKRNAQLSTGPRTPEGQEKSRQNSLKHGLTGAGIVLPAEDQAEVQRRFQAFREELRPAGEVGLALVRRAAILSVRMEKCSEQEMAATSERVARALAEFTPPAGASEAEIARLRIEAGRASAFDPSPEASLLRRYESAAERGFYRALKELRLVEKQVTQLDPDRQAEVFRQELGSILEMSKLDAEMDALYPELAVPTPRKAPNLSSVPPQGMPGTRVDVPITIGRPR